MTLNVFEFTVSGNPVAKGRPRVYGKYAKTPEKTANAENWIRVEFRQTYPDFKPIEGPVRLNASFYMAKRGKPDTDNLLKLVLDSLNGVAYRDDAQVVEIHTKKIMPCEYMPAKKPGKWRRRKSGDQLAFMGTGHVHEYEPHTSIQIVELPVFQPNN